MHDPTRSTRRTFHAGEQTLQARVGVRERLAEVAHNFIRPAMPEEHREMFSRLPFVVVGSVDPDGAPSASLVIGTPGFIRNEDARHLWVSGHCLAADPLRAQLRVGAPLGLLGIQLETRRRNRANGFVVERDGDRRPSQIHARRASRARCSARSRRSRAPIPSSSRRRPGTTRARTTRSTASMCPIAAAGPASCAPRTPQLAATGSWDEVAAARKP